MLRHGSLFSGIRGFELAAQWAGFENVFSVEINDWCNKIGKKHFPETTIYEDIKDFDGTKYKGAIDIVSGGFPCQPFSVAGKQKGGEDDRNLWPEMFRVIQEIQPTWVVGENVAAITTFVEFDNLLADLEGEGFEVQTFIIPACGVDAKHRRNRVWIVGHSEHNGSLARQKPRSDGEAVCNNQKGQNEARESAGASEAGNVANTRCQYGEGNPKRMEADKTERTTSILHSQSSSEGFSDSISADEYKVFANATGQRQQGSGKFKQPINPEKNKRGETSKSINDGVGAIWKPEPNVGRVANGVPNRVDRLRGLGNAVVPQIPFRIFETIKNI